MTWEQRYHPLRKEWVLIAAHRQNRPWSGETVPGHTDKVPSYDPECYLCPGNTRVHGDVNPAYDQTFVFDNDHPCVGQEAPLAQDPKAPIFQSRQAKGISRVVCYSPQHNTSLSKMSPAAVTNLLKTWRAEYEDLGSRDDIEHVLIFENRGEVVGVSNPHPHCQIYATNFVAKTIEVEARAAAEHYREYGRSLLGDVLDAELEDGRRIVFANQHAVAFLPYFARYAYEVFVAPRAPHPSLSPFDDSELEDFAQALLQVLKRFDGLWNRPFPYVMVLHQAPTLADESKGFHFHIEFHPPLRKPNLLKYLAGPEIGGGIFLSDTAPEEKAAELRAVPVSL